MTRRPALPAAAEEFYVGYDPAMPSAIAARVTRVVAAVAVVAATGAGAILVSHHRLTPSTFEFGRPQAFEGTLRRMPYPRLEIDGRIVWLVGPGKTAADAALDDQTDGPVSLRGTRAARRGQSLIEVVPGSVATVDPGAAPLAPEPMAPGGPEVTLVGEIVDSKCFLGVMNPGNGTVHRDCARVCLRGGMPPMLLTRGPDGQEALVLLVGPQGGAIADELASVAGVPVRVTGRLSSERGLLVMATASSQIRLL